MRLTIKSWLRDRRGAASIECALGTVVMVTASFLALELYRQVNAQARVAHSAVALAEYASQDEDIQALFIDSLAEFLHTEQFNPANAAFIVSAVRQDASPTLLWTRQALFGPQAATRLASCSRITQGGITLPPDLVRALRTGDVVIVAEACVEQTLSTTTRVLYSYYITPSRAARDPNLI